MNTVFEEVAERLFVVKSFDNGRILIHFVAEISCRFLRHGTIKVQIDTLQHIVVRWLILSHLWVVLVCTVGKFDVLIF